jgi:broad specificity phosphatase PhoE
MLREETEMLVFVIRHAQQEHGQGSDPPLAEAGRAQAARLAQAFPGQRLDRVVCSTMRRGMAIVGHAAVNRVIVTTLCPGLRPLMGPT